MKNKKITIIFILIIAIIVGMSFCRKNNNDNVSTNSIIISDEKMKFDKNDVVIDGLRFGMTPDEVQSDFGKPIEINHVTRSEFMYGEYIDYVYEDKILTFFDTKGKGNLTLGTVNVTGKDVKLVNELAIGSSYEEVINAYYNDNQERKLEDEFKNNEPWALLLYGDYLYTYSQGYKLPEKYEQTAFVHLDGNYISYNCYIPMEERFENVSLTFYLDADKKVSNIRWSID